MTKARSLAYERCKNTHAVPMNTTPETTKKFANSHKPKKLSHAPSLSPTPETNKSSRIPTSLATCCDDCLDDLTRVSMVACLVTA